MPRLVYNIILIMKIYFDQSGRGIKEFGKYYDAIYKEIERLGHSHLRGITSLEYREKFYNGSHESRVDHYKKTIEYIKKADLIVLEVSMNSLSMGYIMERSLQLNKPVIALYLKDFRPSFVEGIVNDKLQLIEYSEANLIEVLSTAIDYAAEQQDTRFNFFISPRHQNYLDWIAKNKKIPRSVYLRDLIEKDMESNEEFS